MDHCSVPADADLHSLLSSAKGGKQSAFETLLSLYSPLIDSMSAGFSDSPTHKEDYEDFRQEACIAFYQAVLHYDPERKEVSFGLYAKECIRNRLISYQRRLRRHESVVSLENTPEEVREPRRDPAERLIEEEAYLDLYRKIQAVLSPYEGRVWWLYLSGHTAGEIAAILKKEERSVQNAIYRIRKKLRRSFSNP